MPALVGVLMAVLRMTIFSPALTVRVALWRAFPFLDPILGFHAQAGMRGVRWFVHRGVRRGWWAADSDFVRLVEIVTRYDTVLHREVTRRHLWRPLFVASFVHDARSFYVTQIDPPPEGKTRVEFQSANGDVSFWAQRRERLPPNVAGGARWRQRRQRSALA